jgi:hypothetical protein
MAIAKGFFVEQAFILLQSVIFLTLGIVQVSLWWKPSHKPLVKEIQKGDIIPVCLQNALLLIVGIDPRCIYGILTPETLLILAVLIIQVLLVFAVVWWRVTTRVQENEFIANTLQYDAAKRAKIELSVILVLIVILPWLASGISLITKSVRYMAICMFAIVGILCAGAFLTWQLLNIVGTTKDDVVHSKDYEGILKVKFRVLVTSAAGMLLFGIYLMMIPISVTIRDAIIPGDVQVYTISLIEYFLFGASILASLLFLRFGWIPLKVTDSNLKTKRGLKSPLLESTPTVDNHNLLKTSKSLLKTRNEDEQ